MSGLKGRVFSDFLIPEWWSLPETFSPCIMCVHIVNGKDSCTATQTQTKDNLLCSLWYLRGGREGAHIPSPVMADVDHVGIVET